jgi:hypothetical protein
MDNFKDMLSTRSRNGIARCFGRDALDTPEIIADAGAARLGMTVQLGLKSLREIAFALYCFRYIEDIKDWL